MSAPHPSDVAWAAGGGPFIAPAEAAGLPKEQRLQVRWLGTAGYELRCGDTTVLIDPYVSRIGLWPMLSRRRVTPDAEAIRRWTPEADAIFVGHSHFDHVMDVPLIARLTGALVYGSQSTANLCQAAGLPATQVTALATAGQTVEIGPFRIQAVPSEHSRFLFGRVPYPGEIPCTCELPTSANRYSCGQVFAFLIRVNDVSLYHAGSANLIDDAIQLPEVDVLMMCIAGRQATDRFIGRIIAQTRPNRVLPMHYDNFFRPLGADMRLLPRTAFGRLLDDISALDPSLEVQTIGLLDTVTLGVGGSQGPAGLS